MIPYIGGKNFLASWIISNFPPNYQKMSYCEVFGGGGWVLFKKETSTIETYNDKNKNLVTLFNVIKNNFDQFNYRAEWTLHSREMYEEARKRLKDDKFINDVEKSICYAISKIQSFSSQGGFGYAINAQKLFSGKWLPFLKRLSIINARLKKVQIECLDFQECISKYDSRNTLFYVDPPYVDCEAYYDAKGVQFRKDDHIRLSQQLKKIKGNFILSYYDHPLVIDLYKKYRIIKKQSVKHSYVITSNSKITKRPKSTELLIMNY